MIDATLCIRGHFDGKVIVPDQPLDLPVDAPLDIELKPAELPATSSKEEIARKLAALESFANRIRLRPLGPGIPAEALRREQMYGDEER